MTVPRRVAGAARDPRSTALGVIAMRNRWGNEETTCERFVDRGQEVCSHSRFHDISEGAGGEAGTDEIGVGMNRQENDLGGATGLIQLIGRLDAVQDWH